MQWRSHVARISGYRLPKKLFYDQLKKRLQHKLWKKYKDFLKLKPINIKIDLDN